eukprot:Skav213917  [mRNA]  locus=scaffold1439:247839:248996:- [translate_table: standard]
MFVSTGMEEQSGRVRIHLVEWKLMEAGAMSAEPSKKEQGSSANEALSLDKGTRDDLMRLFLQLDRDGDGSLNQKEFAAAKQLLTSLCGELTGSVKQPAVPVRSEDFMTYAYAASCTPACKLTLTQIVKEMTQILSRKPSNFDESVSELKPLDQTSCS